VSKHFRRSRDIQLHGKNVIVTGASRGLGRALAIAFARRGARLALSARDAAGLEETAALCREAGAPLAVCVVADVTRSAECAQMADEAARALGGVDVLVANAGMSMWASFEEIRDPAVFEKLVQVNYLGAVYWIHAALPHLLRSRGLIVAISSAQAWTGMPMHTGYAASKAALQGFLDSLEMEMNGRVRVLGVYPGWIRDTELRLHALGVDGRELGAARRSHSSESVTSEECAALVVRAVEQGKHSIFIPRKLRLLHLLRPLAFPVIRRILTRAVHSQPGRQ
jgi:NAD(P)-dependent dehydrogenase (short-subunit alcohol dehydrogenase family)